MNASEARRRTQEQIKANEQARNDDAATNLRIRNEQNNFWRDVEWPKYAGETVEKAVANEKYKATVYISGDTQFKMAYIREWAAKNGYGVEFLDAHFVETEGYWTCSVVISW